MELYMTLCYFIKYDDVEFLSYAIQEICIILQALLANKSKYACKMLRQVYIFDINALDLLLQETYLTIY